MIINFISKKSFYIFFIKKLFSDSTYINLKNNFPSPEKGYFIMPNGKKTISSGSEEFLKILEENYFFKYFFYQFIQKKKLYFLYFRLLPYFIYSRKHIIFDVIKLLRFPRFHIGKFSKNIFFNDISIGFQISYMSNKAKIVPHTDSISKLLSLMIYFPDGSVPGEENFGTVFFDSSSENYYNEHLSEENKEKIFKKNNKIIYKALFKDDNIIYGFIKNEKSWHCVDTINASDNYIRRSININFNLT